jgi:hypothetical protein
LLQFTAEELTYLFPVSIQKYISSDRAFQDNKHKNEDYVLCIWG